jgi:hypothetical protein
VGGPVLKNNLNWEFWVLLLACEPLKIVEFTRKGLWNQNTCKCRLFKNSRFEDFIHIPEGIDMIITLSPVRKPLKHRAQKRVIEREDCQYSHNSKTQYS